MNKLLWIIMLVFVGCGQKYEVVLVKIKALKESRDEAMTNRTQLFRHFELMQELLDFEIPKKTKIPAQIDCASFVLGSEELADISCLNGLFNTCPREMDQYSILSERLVEKCESLKDEA